MVYWSIYMGRRKLQHWVFPHQTKWVCPNGANFMLAMFAEEPWSVGEMKVGLFPKKINLQQDDWEFCVIDQDWPSSAATKLVVRCHHATLNFKSPTFHATSKSTCLKLHFALEFLQWSIKCNWSWPLCLSFVQIINELKILKCIQTNKVFRNFFKKL